MNPFRCIPVATVVSLSLSFLAPQVSLAQRAEGYHEAIRSGEVPQISGGGEMNMLRNRGMQPAAEKSSAPHFRPSAKLAAGPVLGVSFDALDFVADGSYNGGYYHIPPDPIGAAGPSHVVCVVNTSIEWYTKAGVLAGGKRLGKNATTVTGSFFESLSPLNGTFDPKVIYDQYASRFLVVTLEQTDTSDGDPDDTSRILVAVSATSDPSGAWYYHAINAKLNIGGVNRWIDYPGFAVDDKAVYITGNMFGFAASGGVYAGARLWIIDKGLAGGFYADGTALVTLHDPPTSTLVSATTMQPAHMFGAVPSGLGTYLVRYSGFTAAGDEALSIIQVDNPLTAPTFTHTFVPCGDIDNTGAAMPNAPQSGTGVLIDTGDRRSLNAVWRDNHLYVAATLVPPSGVDAGQATAHWFDVSTPGLTLADQGNLGGEDIATGTYTFYPSIAADAAGNLGIGFAASASTIFPGAYFSGKKAGDPAGTNRGSGVLRAGLDYYERTFGAGRNRWGDYSGTCVDPSDDAFWFFNEYAIERGTVIGGEDGRWGTAFGYLPATALPIQIASFIGTVEDNRYALLRWETISEINNFGFEVQKSTEPLSGYKTIADSFVPGHGTTTTRQEYSYGDLTTTHGTWYYRLKQLDLDGTVHYSQSVVVHVTVTDVAEETPKVFRLDQNYPNPFNPGTVLSVQWPAVSDVTLTIIDLLGREIATVVTGRFQPGQYTFPFDASRLSSGMYLYRLEAKSESGVFVDVKKMIVLR